MCDKEHIFRAVDANMITINYCCLSEAPTPNMVIINKTINSMLCLQTAHD